MVENSREKKTQKKKDVSWKSDEELKMTIKKGHLWKADKDLKMIIEESVKKKKKK